MLYSQIDREGFSVSAHFKWYCWGSIRAFFILLPLPHFILCGYMFSLLGFRLSQREHHRRPPRISLYDQGIQFIFYLDVYRWICLSGLNVSYLATHSPPPILGFDFIKKRRWLAAITYPMKRKECDMDANGCGDDNASIVYIPKVDMFLLLVVESFILWFFEDGVTSYVYLATKWSQHHSLCLPYTACLISSAAFQQHFRKSLSNFNFCCLNNVVQLCECIRHRPLNAIKFHFCSINSWGCITHFSLIENVPSLFCFHSRYLMPSSHNHHSSVENL